MKDDPGGVPPPGPDPAHAVTQVHPMIAARSYDRPMADGKDRSVTLTEIQHLDA